jgi:hypothetical protein
MPILTQTQGYFKLTYDSDLLETEELLSYKPHFKHQKSHWSNTFTDAFVQEWEKIDENKREKLCKGVVLIVELSYDEDWPSFILKWSNDDDMFILDCIKYDNSSYDGSD